MDVAQLIHLQGPWLKYKGHLTNISENLRTSIHLLAGFILNIVYSYHCMLRKRPPCQ